MSKKLVHIPGTNSVRIEGSLITFDLITAIKEGDIEKIKSYIKINKLLINNLSQSQTPLNVAVMMGNIPIVKLLLDNGADINFQGASGYTPLHIASQKGDSEIVKMLLNKDGIDVNKVDKDGNTALNMAISKKNNEIVGMLLNTEGIDVNKGDIDGNTPLHMAISKKNIEIIKILLDSEKIEVNKTAGKNGRTPLYIAIDDESIEIVKMLLSSEKIEIYKESYGYTPLHMAISKKNIEIIKMLLSSEKIEVNKESYGSTPLEKAISEGSVEIVKMLLNKDGIDVNKVDKDGNTPLHMAISKKNIEIVGMLVNTEGIDVNKGDIDGNTALHMASLLGRNEIIKMLLASDKIDLDKEFHNALSVENIKIIDILLKSSKINVNKVDKDGSTPLHSAIRARHDEIIVKMLLNNDRIDPNKVDIDGDTPLHIASLLRHKEIVKMLLNNDRIDPNKVDKNGSTPLCISIAIAKGNDEIVKMLLDNKEIDVNKVDKNGNNSLLLAAWRKNFELLNVLLEKGADLSVVNIGNQNIFNFLERKDPVVRELFMKYGGDYILLEQDDALKKISESVQSAHSINTINKVYQELKVEKNQPELKGKITESKKKFEDLLKNILQPEQGSITSEFQKLFLQLIKHKLEDCRSNKGQGDKFIIDLLKASKSEITMEAIKKDFDSTELLDKFAIFIAGKESKKYFGELVTKGINLVNDIKDNTQISETSTINSSLLIPLIFSTVKGQQAYQDLVIETIDAATMYASGTSSCIVGTLNKLSQVLVRFFPEEEIDKIAVKQQFPYDGFQTNTNALVEEIFNLLGNNKSENLTNLEAQKIRANVYKIMKDLTSDISNFSKIFSYSGDVEGANIFSNSQAKEKIAEFKQQVAYEMISKVQKAILTKQTMDGKTYFNIPKECLSVNEAVINKETKQSMQDPVPLFLQKIQTKLFDLEDEGLIKIGTFFTEHKEKLKDFSSDILKEMKDSKSDLNDKFKGILEDFINELGQCANLDGAKLINNVIKLFLQRGGVKKWEIEASLEIKLSEEDDAINISIQPLNDKQSSNATITFHENYHEYKYDIHTTQTYDQVVFINLEITGGCTNFAFPPLQY